MRDVVFVNPADIQRLGLEAGQQVDLISLWDDGIERRVRGFTLLAYDTPLGLSTAGVLKPEMVAKMAEYAGRHFCPRCGSSVFSRLADEIEVHLGALDAPDQLTPTYECWTVRREGWLPPFPLNRRYQHDRDDSSRFE